MSSDALPPKGNECFTCWHAFVRYWHLHPVQSARALFVVRRGWAGIPTHNPDRSCGCGTLCRHARHEGETSPGPALPGAPYSKALLMPFSLHMDRDRYSFVSSPKDYRSNGFCSSFSRFTDHIGSGAGRRYTCDGEFWRLRTLEEITRAYWEDFEAIQSKINEGLRLRHRPCRRCRALSSRYSPARLIDNSGRKLDVYSQITQ
jgi:hypothetical protein